MEQHMAKNIEKENLLNQKRIEEDQRSHLKTSISELESRENHLITKLKDNRKEQQTVKTDISVLNKNILTLQGEYKKKTRIPHFQGTHIEWIKCRIKKFQS